MSKTGQQEPVLMIVTKRSRLVKDSFQHRLHRQQQREKNVTNYIPDLKASPKSYPCYFNSYFIVMTTSKSVGKYSPTVFGMINP